MAGVFFYDDFKAGSGTIHIDPVQKNASGSGKTAYIYSNSNKSPIYLQLTRKGTKMTVPFGISDGFSGNESSNRKSLDVSFQDESLSTALESIEKYIVEYMVENSPDYFGKKKSLDSVQRMFHSCVKRSDQYRPLVRTKVNLAGKFATNFWQSTTDASVTRGKSTDIIKHMEVSVIVRLTSVWFASGRFGIILDVHDLIYFPIVVPNVPLFMSDDGTMQYNLDVGETLKTGKSIVTSTNDPNNQSDGGNADVVLLSDGKPNLDYGAF